MSDTNTSNGRDQRSGRFLAGNAGNGGRKPGQRNKLGEQFISDLKDVWLELGPEALRASAKEDPTAFCRIIASLLPRDINLNIGLNPAEFLATFRDVRAALGNDEAPKLRRTSKLIEHDEC